MHNKYIIISYTYIIQDNNFTLSTPGNQALNNMRLASILQLSTVKLQELHKNNWFYIIIGIPYRLEILLYLCTVVLNTKHLLCSSKICSHYIRLCGKVFAYPLRPQLVNVSVQ